ncbi:hypothetical protein PCANC_02805 [Puccinia coronata f. sp. avenae]|uniref:Uncharacterized protein n=1 Tax=Puccinia coronata f. sp. avenae TaxID=200324 RepID=A0A2N5S4N6_9BASI|nr:hypothetical protein PCASD_24633 [Puccinia coronata f. sp. avenae]PLW15736.1 hypothetical protein PCANC_16516 [Puccinia coronata f. sp. avenae]PLW57024.1 hypothetical protein PCANC_02805 [Puccinia coronata f. sp. avenae]
MFNLAEPFVTQTSRVSILRHDRHDLRVEGHVHLNNLCVTCRCYPCIDWMLPPTDPFLRAEDNNPTIPWPDAHDVNPAGKRARDDRIHTYVHTYLVDEAWLLPPPHNRCLKRDHHPKPGLPKLTRGDIDTVKVDQDPHDVA